METKTITELNDIRELIKNHLNNSIDVSEVLNHLNDFEKQNNDLLIAKEKAESVAEKYSILFENMTQGAFYQNADGTMIDINPAGLQMLGLTKDQFNGRTSYHPDWKVINENNELIPPDQYPSMLALKTGKESEKVLAVYNPMEKSYRWLIINSRPLFRNNETEPYQVFVTMHDISNRKKTENLLQFSEKKYRKLHESMMDGFVFVSMNGFIIDSNLSYQQMLGYNAEELSKLTYIDLTPPKWHIEESKIVNEQILTHGFSDVYEKEYIRKDGVIIPVEIRAFLIKNDMGEDDGIWAIVREISKRKQAEEALKERENLLKEINDTKDKFFAIISHDLRSPISSIVSFSNILNLQLSKNNLCEAEKFAGYINSSSKRILNLLIDLIEWSRAESGRLIFKPENIDIYSIISETTDLLNDSAIQKSISINKSLSDNITIYADRDMICTVLRNLISNAIKFTKEGGEIKITYKHNRKEITICVSDTGIGISKKNLNKLFRIDENYVSTGTMNEKGSGMGLILCREFIEKHGGRIWAESEVEKGSCFCFSIPLNNSELK